MTDVSKTSDTSKTGTKQTENADDASVYQNENLETSSSNLYQTLTGDKEGSIVNDQGVIDKGKLETFLEKAAIEKDKDDTSLTEIDPNAILFLLKEVMGFEYININDPAVIYLSHHMPDEIMDILSDDGASIISKSSTLKAIREIGNNPVDEEEESYNLKQSKIFQQKGGKSLAELEQEYALDGNENGKKILKEKQLNAYFDSQEIFLEDEFFQDMADAEEAAHDHWSKDTKKKSRRRSIAIGAGLGAVAVVTGGVGAVALGAALGASILVSTAFAAGAAVGAGVAATATARVHADVRKASARSPSGLGSEFDNKMVEAKTISDYASLIADDISSPYYGLGKEKLKDGSEASQSSAKLDRVFENLSETEFESEALAVAITKEIIENALKEDFKQENKRGKNNRRVRRRARKGKIKEKKLNTGRDDMLYDLSSALQKAYGPQNAARIYSMGLLANEGAEHLFENDDDNERKTYEIVRDRDYLGLLEHIQNSEGGLEGFGSSNDQEGALIGNHWKKLNNGGVLYNMSDD